MKKLVFILVLTVMLFVIAGCSKEDKVIDTLSEFTVTFNSLEPLTVHKVTETYSDNILLSRDTADYAESDGIIYEKKVTETISAENSSMVKEEYERYYSQGFIWVKEGSGFIKTEGTRAEGEKINLNGILFDNVSIKEEGGEYTFEAVIKDEMIALFLSDSVIEAGNMRIKLSARGDRIISMSLSYETELHRIVIKADYGYDAEVLTLPETE